MEQAKANLDELSKKDDVYQMIIESKSIDFAQARNSYGILEYKVNEIKARIGNANSVKKLIFK